MNEHKNNFSHDDLFTEFKEEELFSYVNELRYQAENFLRNAKMPQSIYLNHTIYAYCCRDALEDIAVLRRHHGLTSKNNVKLKAYTAAWWIRRKPFQHRENLPKQFLYVNESFAATLLFQASNLYDKNAGRYTVDTDKIVEIAAPLMDYLKFRRVDPVALELFMRGLNFSTQGGLI